FIHPSLPFSFQPSGQRLSEGFTSGRPNPRLAEASSKQTLHITLPLPPRCYEKIGISSNNILLGEE
ncbi:MAG: hypothetical protein J7L30_02425, partial [Methanophagales archaeon]|nr:hypothetical protein [Methanophagales archaeon]